jgi:diguanylate cyclase (GGDEF)-like protein
LRTGLRLVPLNAIRLLCVFVATAATIGCALFIYFGHENATERAENELRNYAHVLVEQTDRALQAVEFVQKVITERIRFEMASDARSFDDVAGSGGLFKALAERAADLPHINGLAVIRKDGEIVATSQKKAKYRPQNIGDREYFRIAAGAKDNEVTISDATESRVSGVKSIMVSRKITSEDGTYLGIINASLDIEHFTALYSRLASKNYLQTRLVRNDGARLAQFPQVGNASASPHIAQRLWPLLKITDTTTTTDITTPSGERRLVAVKGSAAFPVSILVSDAYDGILASWRLQATGIAVAAVLMNIAIVIAWFLGRRHVEASILQTATERFLARHDVLTKAPNRLYFVEKMQRTLDAATESGREFALLVIDLNRFKEINDTLGHPIGDLMIQSFAARLRETVRPCDFVARIGGDEFAVIVKDIACLEEAEAFALRLVTHLAAPHQIGDKLLQCKCSIGISIGPTHGSNADELLKAADLALYAAKADPARGFRFYDAELNSQRLRRRDLEAALPRAIENGEFELHYQPIVSLKTGRYWGFESLVRWRRPEQGLIPPYEFIPTLEAIGLIIPLGRRILIDACMAASKWPASMHISVNVSPIQLASDDIIEHIREALERSSLRASRLTIEVTESVLLGDGALERLRRIRRMGVSIALDDFGTGFASMSYLESYPYDKIKIDRSFVANMANPKSRAIVEATINLARALKIETTAEGVETQQQLAELRAAGASQAQGYLFAKPMPESQIAGFLQQAKPARAA